MKKNLPIIVITGATASGKTKKAIAAAKRYDAEIVCADSKIVYKGFNIATAKPTIEEREGVAHHLIDIVEPVRSFSAGDFVEYANRAVKDIQSRGRNVIIAGGTWFYIKSLLDSEKLPDIPANPSLRRELSLKSPQELWRELDKLDHKRALQVHINNTDKVIRSIEMCHYLNAPISEHKREKSISTDVRWFALDMDREELYNRINQRVDEMVEMGLEKEFRKLFNKYGANEVIESTIGYKEFIEEEIVEKAIYKIKQDTRNLAKRQMTWLRNAPDINFISPDENIKVM